MVWVWVLGDTKNPRISARVLWFGLGLSDVAVDALEICSPTHLAVGVVATTVECDAADDAEALAELVVVVGRCGRGQGGTSLYLV